MPLMQLAITSALSDASVAVRKGFVQKAWDKLTSDRRSKDAFELIGNLRFMAYAEPVSLSLRSRSWFP